MPFLLLKDMPRYDCLLEAAKRFPDLDPSAAEVYLHVLRAGDVVFDWGTSHIEAHNLSQGRFTVLMLLLDKASGCPKAHSPAELAEHSGVTRATMTGLIDTLERDGYVTREPDPGDRRQMIVSMTPRALEFMQGFLPGHFRRMSTLIATLEESERRTLVRLLDKINARAADLRAAEAGEAPRSLVPSDPAA